MMHHNDGGRGADALQTNGDSKEEAGWDSGHDASQQWQQGRLMHHTNCGDEYCLSVAGWDSGLMHQ